MECKGVRRLVSPLSALAGRWCSAISTSACRERPTVDGWQSWWALPTMWSSNNLVCSMKNGLRFENNNYILGKRPAKAVKREPSTRLWIYYVVTGVAAVVCYVNSLQGEFVHDDIPAIVNNADVRGDTDIREIFTHDFWGKSISDNTSHKSYRPLTVLTFRYVIYLCMCQLASLLELPPGLGLPLHHEALSTPHVSWVPELDEEVVTTWRIEPIFSPDTARVT